MIKDAKGTKGYLVNCHIDLKYTEGVCGYKNDIATYGLNNEGDMPLFELVVDPKSGIEYLVARLDGYKITKIKD